AEVLISEVEQFEKIQYKDRPAPADKPKADEKDKSAARSRPAGKRAERPPTIGGDLPGTDGPTQREPDERASEEFRDAVRKATRDMLAPFMDKTNPLPNQK